MSKSEFVQKTALITGACGGLGRAIAETFLRAGTNVVTCDINDKLISTFNNEVSSAYPDRTLVLNLDVTQDGNIEKLFAEGGEKFGSIDYVVNNAGRIDKFDPVGDMDKKIWDAVIALNLTAPAIVCKTAVNAWLKAGKKGAIVNIGSIAAFRGFTCGAAYTASKHGLLGLTKNTAAFYGPKGIRCNLIMPGAMITNIGNSLAQGVNMEGMGVMRLNFPEQGGMPPVDTAKVSELVLFLCSDAADIINGTSMTADGGATAN